MGRHRVDTVNSIVQHGEFIKMSLYGDDTGWYWGCTCGDRGDAHIGSYARAAAALDWVQHVDVRHPEVAAAAGELQE